MIKHTNPDMLETPVQQYKGWDVRVLNNHWIKLYITPELGGRIIQTELDGYGFFFVNPALEGKIPEGGRNDSWMNFGGEKIWPAPQGWGSPDLWPGPPDPVLDSGPYEVNENVEWNQYGLELVSLEDAYTGLQIHKNIQVSADRAEICIRATFINHSESVREWSIWPVFQLNTAGAHLGGRYSVICPVNPESQFEKGYKVMHGLVNNPQNKIDPVGNLVVDYQYLVGKVGLDSNANWVAFCDTQTGKVFVTTFEHQQDARYPEDTSVQIWTQGRGMVYSRNKVVSYPDHPENNPPYLEMELLSPLYQMQPGEEAYFDYKVMICTIPAMHQVQSANTGGVVAEPLLALMSQDGIMITGKFGFFMAGTARMTFRDQAEKEIMPDQYAKDWSVTPLGGLSISLRMDNVPIGDDVMVCIDLYDPEGTYLCELNRTQLCRI
jgi:hypothetical protein